MTAALMLAAVFLAAWVLTGRLRQYALAHRLIDVPNARSSHQVDTPRGGGGAIVVASSAALAWLTWSGGSESMPAGVLGSALIVAAVGFVDDHGHLAPTVRLAGHLAAAVGAVKSLGGAPPLLFLGHVVAVGAVGDLVAVLFVVWLLNLTNFMDGIDGIAGAQVVTVCICGVLLYRFVSSSAGLWVEPAILAAATAGFLVWNWPPARIFMGDVGSGYIGFMVAILSLRAARVAPMLWWSWMILSAVFIVDATTTLLGRAARRERVYQAHRAHAYQHLAVAWRSHRRVTLLIVAINLFWLAPISFLVASGRIDELTGIVLAYVPLTAGAIRLGAGGAGWSRAARPPESPPC